MLEPAPEIPIEAFTTFADGLDHPECCAFDREGYLWAGGEVGQIYRMDPRGGVEEVTRMGGFCGGSHQIFRVTPERELIMVAHDPTGIVIGAPTNLTFAGPEWRDMCVANLSRTTIVCSRAPRPGLPPAKLRVNSVQ